MVFHFPLSLRTQKLLRPRTLQLLMFVLIGIGRANRLTNDNMSVSVRLKTANDSIGHDLGLRVFW